MPRDYKHARRSPSPKPRGWDRKSLLSGLALGAVIVSVIHYSDRLPDLIPTAVSETGSRHPHAREARPAPRQADKPKFEFYTMLPEMEVAVPERDIEPRVDKPEERPAPAAEARLSAEDSGDLYVLQVGSFRRPQDADRLRAQLALLGLEAHVQTVVINGEETWHRVRLGPFSEKASLNEARGRLYNNQIDSHVFKLRS